MRKYFAEGLDLPALRIQIGRALELLGLTPDKASIVANSPEDRLASALQIALDTLAGGGGRESTDPLEEAPLHETAMFSNWFSNWKKDVLAKRQLSNANRGQRKRTASARRSKAQVDASLKARGIDPAVIADLK